MTEVVVTLNGGSLSGGGGIGGGGGGSTTTIIQQEVTNVLSNLTADQNIESKDAATGRYIGGVGSTPAGVTPQRTFERKGTIRIAETINTVYARTGKGQEQQVLTDYVAGKFNTGSFSGNPIAVGIWLRKDADLPKTAQILVKIYTDNGNKPGTLVCTTDISPASLKLNNLVGHSNPNLPSVGVAPHWITVPAEVQELVTTMPRYKPENTTTPIPVELLANTNYWVVLQRNGGFTAGKLFVDTIDSSTPDLQTSSDGVTWNPQNKKLKFRVVSRPNENAWQETLISEGTTARCSTLFSPTNTALLALSDFGEGVRASSATGTGVVGTTTDGVAGLFQVQASGSGTGIALVVGQNVFRANNSQIGFFGGNLVNKQTVNLTSAIAAATQTAGATYTANEQTLINNLKADNAKLRADVAAMKAALVNYGLMT